MTIVSNSNKLFPNVTVGQSNGSNANVTIISQGNQQNNSGYQIITGETKPSVDSNNSKSSFVRVGENQWYYYDQYAKRSKVKRLSMGSLITSLKMVFKLVTHLLKVAMATLIITNKNGVKAINGFYDFDMVIVKDCPLL